MRNLGLIFLVSRLTFNAFADPIGVTAKIPEGQAIMAGESFGVYYQISLPVGGKLDLSSWKASQTQWSQFTLWDFALDVKKTEDKNIVSLSVKLIPFTLGKSEIPTIEIAYKTPGSGQTKILKTPPLPLEIGDPTQGAKDAAQPRDIKAPRKPLYFWEHPLGIALMIFLALMILGAFLVYKSRQRIQGAAVKEALIRLTPEEAFYKGLNEIEAKGWLEQRKYREFYFALSEVFRQYLERRFALNLESLTSREILKEMSVQRDSLQILSSNIAPLRATYEIMDLAKFAKYSPTAAETAATIESLKSFVENSRPKPKPPALLEAAKT